MHRYIIIKCRSSSIKGKIHQLLWELWPFFNLKSGFLSISALDSYFIQGFIIIKYR